MALHGEARGDSSTRRPPDGGVVSVGADNRYGHPSPAAMERLRRRDIEVLRTDRMGSVIWHVEPDTAWWETSAEGRGVWY